MLIFYNKHQSGEYSQNGEAGIIDECIKRIRLIEGIAIEFGAPTKSYCSNIFHLGPWWNCIYYDPNPKEIGIYNKFITTSNVNALFDCQILSIDIDGNDYNVWQAYHGRPDIVIIEINSSIDPTADGPVSDLNHGTAYKPMVELGIRKGYFLLCHTGNLVFILNKYRSLFPEVVGDGVENYQEYFNTKWL